MCRLRPEDTPPQPLPPAAAPNTGRCPIDYKYVDSQTITVKLKGGPASAAAAPPAGITTFCPRSSDTFIIERISSLQSCMHKKNIYTNNAVALAFSVCRLRPEATAPQPLPPTAAPNTGQCPIDYKYVDSQTITVKLKGGSAAAAAAPPAGITTFCPRSSDTCIIEGKSSLQSCMHKKNTQVTQLPWLVIPAI